jgi:hypothetical protein
MKSLTLAAALLVLHSSAIFAAAPALGIETFEAPPFKVFTDLEESPSSQTHLKASLSDSGRNGHALRLEYSVPKNRELGYQYAGASYPLRGKALTGYKAISFWARMVSGQAPPFRLQIRAGDPEINNFVFVSLSGLGREWRQFSVPLRKFNRLSPEMLAHPHELAFVVMRGEGTIEIDDAALESRADEAAVPAFPKRGPDLPRGLAAWCYQDMRLNAATIKAANAQAPEAWKIRYAFVWGGDLDFDDGQAHLALDFSLARQLAAELKGEHVMVFPMVDGTSFAAEGLSPADWRRLGRELANAIDAEPTLAGLHFDIEPHTDDLHWLFAEVKSHSSKPLSAAVGAWSPESFRYVDFLVLMGYDLATNPKAYEKAAGPFVERFMADAAAAGGRAMIGLPFIATHREFEARKESAISAPQPNGYSMLQYVDAGLRATKKAVQGRDAAFMGFSIWALHPQEGLHGRQDKAWFYPTQLSESLWARLRDPLR